MVLRGKLRGRVGHRRGLFKGMFINNEHPFLVLRMMENKKLMVVGVVAFDMADNVVNRVTISDRRDAMHCVSTPTPAG